ncbi:MAG: hypothetical protein OEY14_17210 [Myxococcales bacterium]|nr:hypothetical protein [Myxococcales bacterium]
MKRLRVTLPLIALVMLLLGMGLHLTDSRADAQRGLRVRAFLVQARIPGRLSERGLLQFARRRSARRLTEDTDRPIRERQWRAELVAAFNRPIGDSQFQVLFYDRDEGGRRFVGTPLEIFVSDSSQRTFVQRVRLSRPDFKPNHPMEAVFTVRRQEVGRIRFDLVGEEIERSGVVSFSDEDTRRR